MIRVIDPTGRALEAIRCEPAGDGFEAWCRVWTYRGDEVHISELSWPLARRIVPRLLARYGIGTPPGLFAGTAILV